MDILFKTIHGSRLYGFSTDTSDYDYYTVVAKKVRHNNKQYRARYAKQKIIGDQDSMVIDFGTWMEQCKHGVPQALEAMFSTAPVGEDRIADFRRSFVCGKGVYNTYLRTIKSFALSEDDGIKKRRHALRLALNMREITERGRFNPTLSAEDARWITDMAHKSHSDVYGLAMYIAYEV